MSKRLITFRMNPDDIARLDEYAIARGLDRTAVVVGLIRTLWADPGQKPDAFPASNAGLDLSLVSQIEREEARARFASSCVEDPVSGCWTWRDGSTKPIFYWQGRSFPAARFSLALHADPIRGGMRTYHECENPACVRPEHLRVGTALEHSSPHEGPNAFPSRHPKKA